MARCNCNTGADASDGITCWHYQCNNCGATWIVLKSQTKDRKKAREDRKKKIEEKKDKKK